MSSEFRDLLASRTELELSVMGRKSKKELPRPVWFVLKGNSVLLLPVTGSSTQWYKNLLADSRVKLDVGSSSFAGKATLETRKEAVAEVVRLFTTKYGRADMEQYYAKTLDVAVDVKLESPPRPKNRKP